MILDIVTIPVKINRLRWVVLGRILTAKAFYSKDQKLMVSGQRGTQYVRITQMA